MSLRVHQYVRLWFLQCLVPVPPIHQVLPWISPMHLRYGHHGLAPPCASPPGLYVDTSAILPGIQRVAAQNALGPGRSIPSGPKRFLAPLWRGAVCAADRGARASGSHGRGRAASFGLAVGAGREWSRAWVSWVCGEVPVPVRVRAGAGFGYGESPLGRVLQGASCTCGAAACYSPTPCRVQYHRRARP